MKYADILDDLIQHQSPDDATPSTTPLHSPGAAPAISLWHHFKFIAIDLSSHLFKVTIEVDYSILAMILTQTIELFRKGAIDGFDTQSAPSEYVEDLYHYEIYSFVKQYLFRHHITDFLMHEIVARKIPMANYPRLTSVESLPDKRLGFNFDISTADTIELKEWKHFAFKSPKRKRYKDLDKQVITFIEQKTSANKRSTSPFLVEEDDWAYFETTMLDKNLQPVSSILTSAFWIRIGKQEINEPFIAQLYHKQINDRFITHHFTTHQEDSKDGGHFFSFGITIKAIVKYGQFSLDMFKTTFKLKNKTDVHNKLMEVFSYRNDVSQRKAIIEEVFHLLLSKHRFEVPKHLVIRREESIIQTLSQQPDYHVYKGQYDFELYVEQLAEKQLKEEIIIDQIAYNDNIKVDLKDMSQYLHLFSHKRLKEFTYFKPILEKLDVTSTPINISTLTQAILREKTLNHIIHMLCK